MYTIVVFDFLSHANMHLPFNVGYIKILRAAFPDDEIIFVAKQEHINNLEPHFSENTSLKWLAFEGFNYENRIKYNPLQGIVEARKCLKTAASVVRGKKVRLTAIAGVEAILLREFRRKWNTISASPLHYILHDHLGATLLWRARNPLFRWFDFFSEFQKRLPPGQKWIVLEKGIETSITKMFPGLAGSILALPHPIESLQYPMSRDVNQCNTPRRLKLAFLGVCTQKKGFDVFLDLANHFYGSKFDFWAIGAATPDFSLPDYGALALKPSHTYVPLEKYYAALSETDLVILPYGKAYNFTASGSLLDAFAFSKPVLTVDNITNNFITEKYGQIGPYAQHTSDFKDILEALSFEDFITKVPTWKRSIKQIQADRRPEVLANTYRNQIVNHT